MNPQWTTAGLARDCVKRHLIPGSMPFLLLAVTLGVVLLGAGRAATVARVLLGAVIVLYWVLSLPTVAQALIRRLKDPHGAVERPGDAAGAPTIAVFSNGAVRYTNGQFSVDLLTRRSVFCVFEAARLYFLLQPRTVILSGGVAGPHAAARPESELMRDLLVACGVPAHLIVTETASRNTAEQAAAVANLLRPGGLPQPIIAVTTAAHVPRVLHHLHEQGVDALPSVPRELRYDEGRRGWRRWVPSWAALAGSESAMYEYIALAATACRRWSPPRQNSV